MTPTNISVVIATCNGARHIAEQLQSIADQSLAPCELIVSDDASDDETLQIVDAASRTSALPFRVVRNERRIGYRENFLKAASSARGDLIAFCDQDDVWRSDKLHRCAQAFADPAVTVCAHQARLIDEYGRDIGLFDQGIRKSVQRPPLSYRPWHTFWGFSVVFRRSLLDLAPTNARYHDYIDPQHRIAHDRWICFLGQLVGITVELAEPLVSYRQHGANLFGAGARRPMYESLRHRSEIYRDVAAEMVDLVGMLDPTVLADASCFDRRAAQVYVERELAMAEFRCALHRRSEWNAALLQFASGIIGNRYGSAVRPGPEWRSMARDAAFVASKIRSSLEGQGECA